MCGICAISSQHPISEETIKRMTTVLAHRGPDDEGIYLGNKLLVNGYQLSVALGHRRLAIIDLSPAGHQPMSNEDKTIRLVYNGELYNFHELKNDLEKQGHKFTSQSDAEVIIHSYEQSGPDCVKKFNGIFAFALWDEKQSRLFLARDHFGVKPLYYTRNNKFFAFASEIKALLEIPGMAREIDPCALDNFLTYRFVPSPQTMFKNIYKLPPAHYLIFEKNEIKTGCYWNYVPRLSLKKETDLVAELREKFYTAVKRQMISDVPIGALLSGGVDSAAIVAVMSELSGSAVKTFTVGFEGADEINEFKEARETARFFKTEHYEKIISQKDYQTWLPKSIWHLEEPVGTTSALALYYICEVVKDYVKVVLTGQGADEPLAGYDRYKGEKYAAWYQAIPAPLRKYIIKPLVESLPRSEKL
ncbi:MAG: asparagine synthase (glutamine-hydrolyzing), partial [Planctomycetota bacterium]